MKVNDIVKYVGEESDEIPFKGGDLILLKREEAEGYAAVPFDKPKSKEATLVYTSEVEEIDEDEAADAEDEAAKNAAEDEAEAAAAAKKLAEAEKKAAAAEKKKAAAKKKAATAKKKKKAAAEKIDEVVEADQTQENDDEVVELIETKEVKAALKGKSAVRAARDIVNGGVVTDFTLGGILAKIAAEKLHTKESDPETGEKFTNDRKGFEAFIENDLGLRYRKAQWLIEFYATFSAAGVDPKKLAKAKYSKVKEVLAIVRTKPDEAEEWLDKANTQKFVDLKEEARRYERKIGVVKKTRGKNDATMVSYRFKVFNAQAKAVDEAVAKAKSLIEFEDKDNESMQDAKAIYHIFSEWLQLQG